MKIISKNNIFREKLLNRFVKYVKIWSESSGEMADKGIFPSTKQQWDMARTLECELKDLGLEVLVTENCYVYGYLKSNCKNTESVLFLSHIDTVDEVSGKNVSPQITKKDDDIIIKSDGSTLLGGDDKAGIAAIMTMLDFLVHSPEIKHKSIEVIFSPDEETGHGMDKVPLEIIKSKFAYTVDGGDEGEMESECFNAWSASVNFSGKACHTGDAKSGGMINANLMASDFISKLPENMRPETTENKEGFIAVMNIKGNIENACIELLLRSFYIEEIEKEKKIIENAILETNKKFSGKGSVKFEQQYLNMKEKLDSAPEVISNLEKAYKDADVKIIRKSIRGGTDGSRLTEMGIPTPNIFTGTHEFHSKNEWVSLNQMSKATDILVNLATQI